MALKTAKLAGNQVLREEVQDRLKHNHSPEQIAARLREDFPDDVEMRVVARDHLPVDLRARPRGTETGALARHLRTGRTLRKPRRHADERNGRSGSGGGGHDGDQQVNAQNRAFFADLPDAFDRLERDHADSPVVLTGTGTGTRFSAGLDCVRMFSDR